MQVLCWPHVPAPPSWSPVKTSHLGEVLSKEPISPDVPPLLRWLRAHPGTWGVLSLHTQQIVKALQSHLFFACCCCCAVIVKGTVGSIITQPLAVSSSCALTSPCLLTHWAVLLALSPASPAAPPGSVHWTLTVCSEPCLRSASFPGPCSPSPKSEPATYIFIRPIERINARSHVFSLFKRQIPLVSAQLWVPRQSEAGHSLLAHSRIAPYSLLFFKKFISWIPRDPGNQSEHFKTQ